MTQQACIRVYTNTATPVCQFDNVDSNLLINPVLITRTTASNEAQVDQIFSFNMLDVDAPVIANKDAFILKQGDVDTVDGVKKLTIRVTVDDVLSGMDSTAAVKLLKGLTEYEPTSIQPSNGNQTITYTFTGNYEDLIRRGQIEHFVKLTGLKDRAGNIVVDTDANIQLRVPNVKPGIEITGMKDGDFINGQKVIFILKNSVGEDARQENIFVDLGESSFDFLTDRVNFPSQAICADDPAFECIKFEGNISPTHNSSTIKIKARIVDIWGNEAETFMELGIDNKPPKITDIYSIGSNTNNQVLLNFDISDEDSGLKAVKYTVKDIGNSSFIVEKSAGDDTIAQLEFDTSKLGNEKSFRVEIKATDNVDQVQTKDFTVDITKPTVTLELLNVEKEQSNLILQNQNQTFNIITSTVPDTRAEVRRYVLTLVALDPGLDNISVDGNFAGIASVTDSISLNESLQGRYDLNLSVFDNLGRDISSYSLKDESVPTTQKSVLVDLANPVITNVQSQQQPIPPVNNKFVVHVFADISDHHLVDSTVTASLNQGGSTIAPVKVVRPDAPSNTYLFEFLVEAGSYELTLNAADAAGHSQSQIVPAVTVAPWQVPTVAISTQDGVTDLGSGQDTALMFEFSEPVTGFAAEDIVLTAASGGDAGTLSGLAEQSPGRWTAVYRAPVGVDTGVSLSVTADSYVSATTQLSGGAASLALDVVGSPLTASVSLPEGDEVSRIGTIAVTFTFNRPVSGEVVPLPEEGVWSNIRKNPAMTEITYDFSPQSLAVGTHQVGVAAGYLDDYGNAGLAASVPVTVTNIAPVIGADFSLFEQGGQVVMDVDITDAESALASVRYTVLDLPGSPITVEKTLADGNLSRLSFDAAQLGSADSFRVQVQVTDDAGAVVNRELAVDIAQAAVTLTVPGSQLSGGQLLLTSADPSFTVSTEIPVGSRADVAGYTLTLVAREAAQSDIIMNGQFSGNASVTGQLPVQIAEQGEYDLTLRVQDSLGRTVSEYTLNGDSTATAQRPVLVDLENPVIANVHPQQQAVPPVNNEYVLQVSADISDLHLVNNAVTASLSNGGALIAPVAVIRPDAPSSTYLFEFLVEAGSYELTLNAADAAGHSQSQVVPSVTVAPWQVPTVAISTQDGVTDLGSGQDTILVFDFSEPVTGFAAEDIVLTAASAGDAGTLSGLAEQSPGRWTAVYRAPVGVDTGVTLSVTADSYVSAATQLAGSAASLALDVVGSPLTASVSLPEGNEVSRIGTIAVTFTFNRPVSGEVVPLPEEGVWSNIRKNPAMTEITYDFSPQALAVGTHQVGVAAGYLDDYGNAGLAASVPVTVTNIAPVIGADFSLFEQGGQVVMDVDITDAESALASVRYTVLDLPGSPITVEKTLADGNLSRLSFDAAQLGGADSFRVQSAGDGRCRCCGQPGAGGRYRPGGRDSDGAGQSAVRWPADADLGGSELYCQHCHCCRLPCRCCGVYPDTGGQR